MPHRIRELSDREKRDLDGKARREEWPAAIQKATWGIAPVIGRELGLSGRTIQEWGEPHADKRSPGETLEKLIEIARLYKDKGKSWTSSTS